jgi:hypothetical protein
MLNGNSSSEKKIEYKGATPVSFLDRRADSKIKDR